MQPIGCHSQYQDWKQILGGGNVYKIHWFPSCHFLFCHFLPHHDSWAISIQMLPWWAPTVKRQNLEIPGQHGGTLHRPLSLQGTWTKLITIVMIIMITQQILTRHIEISTRWQYVMMIKMIIVIIMTLKSYRLPSGGQVFFLGGKSSVSRPELAWAAESQWTLCLPWWSWSPRNDLNLKFKLNNWNKYFDRLPVGGSPGWIVVVRVVQTMCWTMASQLSTNHHHHHSCHHHQSSSWSYDDHDRPEQAAQQKWFLRDFSRVGVLLTCKLAGHPGQWWLWTSGYDQLMIDGTVQFFKTIMSQIVLVGHRCKGSMRHFPCTFWFLIKNRQSWLVNYSHHVKKFCKFGKWKMDCNGHLTMKTLRETWRVSAT